MVTTSWNRIDIVLAALDTVRHVIIGEVGDVISGNDQLRVNVDVRLTFHPVLGYAQDADKPAGNDSRLLPPLISLCGAGR